MSLRDTRIPVFAVGAESDCIAPWKSVFKTRKLPHADVTFVLTNGGHNPDVISKPDHQRRRNRVHKTRDSDPAPSADDWLEMAVMHDGS